MAIFTQSRRISTTYEHKPGEPLLLLPNCVHLQRIQVRPSRPDFLL
ncbi:protein of unknown function [Alcaligenes faecalis subsp. faecalis]|nr:protein of unknown function [Alcaligenes faecalis subsp. faecalis]